MIDLRSDTVTRPTDEMRAAMESAEVGDDVYGEDPTVAELEQRAAELLGKRAALMVTSGTQANLVSILAHCDRGDEYVVGDAYHSYSHEGGGAAVLGGIKPEPVAVDARGRIPPEKLRAAVKPADDSHYARTTLVALENPHHGRAFSVEYVRSVAEVAEKHGLATHLDGARIFNAAEALGISPQAIAEPVDTAMISLSKGLGAPVGAVVCGSADFIDEARRWRKVLGGGWRQAGLLAAAGCHALEHHVDRLRDDHERARCLAEGLDRLQNVTTEPEAVETNMVYAELDDIPPAELADALRQHDVLVHPMNPMRLVTHLDISDRDIDRALDAFRAHLS